VVIDPPVFEDERGYHLRAWDIEFFPQLEFDGLFVQESHIHSRDGVLRGLHYQTDPVQGKLVRVVAGEGWDVGIDLREGSPTFGRWHGVWLSAANKRMYWLPVGLAHGFYVPEAADLLMNNTGPYTPESEVTIIWNDPDLGIEWPLIAGTAPILSERDLAGIPFREAPKF
jgi:dTDP-4-dehydrorhamnose 3,5-epimerase